MNMRRDINSWWITSGLLSLLAHALFCYPLGLFATFDLVKPVSHPQAVAIFLTEAHQSTAQVAVSAAHNTDDREKESREDQISDMPSKMDADTPPTEQEQLLTERLPEVPPLMGIKEKFTPSAYNAEPPIVLDPPLSRRSAVTRIPPLRTAGEFLATEEEKLSYRINLHGVPVGYAELEAWHENGEVRISLKVKSSSLVSGVYPVDDSIEIRHIGGNAILTKIRQNEGFFRSDIAFNIMLREKKVLWIDHIKNSSTYDPVPSSDVLDTLSAFYFLRKRQLQVDKTETLNIYNGETYAQVPVEIMRQEIVRLPNLKQVDTLVIRPVKMVGEIFRKAGDILIWLTNDENKVPVRVESNTYKAPVCQ